MDTAVVILNYNGKHHLETYLPSVLNNSHPETRIIVADNGSTDMSIEWLEKNHPAVDIIKLEKNFGFTGGYNRAIPLVDFPYLIFLNSDVEVTNGWDIKLVACLKKEPQIAIVQPKILSAEDRQTFEYAGAAGGMMDRWFYPFCQGRIFDQVEKDHGQYNSPMEIFWASGAAMAIRKNQFEKIGQFMERYFAHMEEIDLCWRFKNAGYKVWYEPASQVYHLGGGTLSYQHPRKLYLNVRNSLWTNLRNLPFPKVIAVYFLRFFLDAIAALRFLVVGELKNTINICKAHFSVVVHLPAIIQSRKKNFNLINNIRIGPPNLKTGQYRKSIIIDFFIRKKKIYQR